MIVYRRAFRLALAQMPPTVPLLFPHRLAEIEDGISDLGEYSDLKMALADVTIFERLHPDMEAFRVSMGATHEELDDLFRLALYIETS